MNSQKNLYKNLGKYHSETKIIQKNSFKKFAKIVAETNEK
jgi:hypothetical protein